MAEHAHAALLELQDRLTNADANIYLQVASEWAELARQNATTLDQVIDWLHHSDTPLRKLAALILWDTGPITEEVIYALEDALEDPSAEVRQLVAWVLNDIDPPQPCAQAA
ncbi:MAG: HEAT repeat domain-containing protein [Gemmataceae bacterium]